MNPACLSNSEPGPESESDPRLGPVIGHHGPADSELARSPSPSQPRPAAGRTQAALRPGAEVCTGPAWRDPCFWSGRSGRSVGIIGPSRLRHAAWRPAAVVRGPGRRGAAGWPILSDSEQVSKMFGVMLGVINRDVGSNKSDSTTLLVANQEETWHESCLCKLFCFSYHSTVYTNLPRAGNGSPRARASR